MTPIEVAAGLVFREGRVLITRRHPGSHLGGLWEFPGGKREPGETFDQALKRELREELGIEVNVGSLFETITHAYTEKTVHLQFYVCDWLKNEPQALDCAEFRWIGRRSIQDHEFPAADKLVVEKLKRCRQLRD